MLNDACQVIQLPDHLIVKMPPSSLFASWIGLIIFLLLPISFLFVMRSAKRNEIRLRSRYPDRNPADFERRQRLAARIFGAISVGAPLFFLALGYSRGSIDLDRAANRATVDAKMTFFLPESLHSVALTGVTGATLDYHANSRRIRLNVIQGQDLTYPIWSNRDGQDQRVEAINNFLKQNPSPLVP